MSGNIGVFLCSWEELGVFRVLREMRTLIYTVWVQYGLLMPLELEELLSVVMGEFPFDVSSMEPVDVGGLDARVFKVDAERSPLVPAEAEVGAPYILDTEAGRRVACHPHIVGRELEGLCLEAAQAFRGALEGLGLYDAGGSAMLHILRGGSGYRVADALPGRPPIVSVRTEYRGDRYRLHSDDGRRIEVTFSDLSGLVGVSTLLVPDTYATGRSAEAALGELFASGLNPERIVLYGFIAIPALLRLGALCSEAGAELFSFAICDIAQLAHNNYDMPLYGLDESLHTSTGELRGLGSIVDLDTLRGLLPWYVAGLDQPGDWSERQRRLFNGFGDEAGDILGHLGKSVGLVESLREMNSGQPWYDDFHDGIALDELERLRETMGRYE